MKIRMGFGAVKTAIIAVVLAGVLALVGLDIAILAGAEGVYSTSVAVPIVSLIAAVLIGVVCLLLLLNSYYKFGEKSFIVMLGFFADKIAYDDVILLKQNIETNELYAIVNDTDPSKPQIGLKINVPASKTDEFIGRLREHIPNVTVELYTQPKKKKKDK